MTFGDESRPDVRRIGAWAGIIGPVLFVVVFTIEGWLRVGYSPMSMFVSELSLGPRGWRQIVNFMTLGASILMLSRGMAADFDLKTMSKTGPLLLALVGLAFVASGPFVMDAASTSLAQMSWHSRLHHLFGAIVFALGPISCLVFFHSFQSDPDWHSLRLPTLFACTAMTLGVVLMKVVELVDAFANWRGLVQRLTLVSFMLWLTLLGLSLLKQTSKRTGRSRP